MMRALPALNRRVVPPWRCIDDQADASETRSVHQPLADQAIRTLPHDVGLAIIVVIAGPYGAPEALRGVQQRKFQDLTSLHDPGTDLTVRALPQDVCKA